MTTKLKLAPYPPAAIRAQLSQEQWTQVLNSWFVAIQYLLSLRPGELSFALHDDSIIQFMLSFVLNSHRKQSTISVDTKEAELKRRYVFLLHHLFFQLSPVPQELLEPDFLAQVSALYARHHFLRNDLQSIWIKSDLEHSPSFVRYKALLVSSLERDPHSPNLAVAIQKAIFLVKGIPAFAKFLMIGSDFVDAVSDAYAKSNGQSTRKQLALLVFYSFDSLMSVPNSTSTTLDHLYSLLETSLMHDLVRKTPFFESFEKFISQSSSGGERATALLKTFASYNPPKFAKRKKGKGKAVSMASVSGPDEVHVHKLSLISQIQDLFPELGSAYIVKLLDEYGDDAELVTAHLLENDLPIYLRTADKSEVLDVPSSRAQNEQANALRIPSTPSIPSIPERRNIYDNDDFDRLAIDSSKLHIGRKDADGTADRLLSAKKSDSHKAAILSALAAFDSDDDERDDTYDSTDVGGIVDTSVNNPEATATRDENDQILLNEYKKDSSVFKRDAETRRSKARAVLKDRTQMTDEAIEGWLIMMEREPSRLEHLERKSAMDNGLHQHVLAPSAWNAQKGAELAGLSDQDESPNTELGQTKGMGRGAGGRGRARLDASQGDSSHLARQRKDANKASRANHNRRNQRAKKMARGGGLVG